MGTEVNYTKSIELIEEILRCKIKDINVDCLGALAFSYKKTLLLLAECYVYGRGIDKNIDKALKICKNFPSEFSAEMLICICLYEKGLYDEAINHCGLLKRQYRIDDGKVDIILLRSYLKTAERSFRTCAELRRHGGDRRRQKLQHRQARIHLQTGLQQGLSY